MKYILSREADEDLIRIHAYGFFRFGEDQADKYFLAFFEQFDVIANNPYLYPSVDYLGKGIRRCVCGVDSIYYQIQDDIIRIVTIVGRQELGRKLKSK
ncbi:type II toxin-antitoxin system RelE/ParE family toxin [Aureibaculum sp. A20]|uniref:Type II toxin-antitoxin system RelE/ParE family toxin n=1 Tax=Aureibaculum flavum TaxID=2795986 RepID=A0ABS0WUR8_9FLAO|nr:type II toxin-antitoxin system RelE/ParE family toxin [Aureibaculum flavum]MBJ2175715.1 type II toxin-antitoxin system RelE/ParE family toxin [Aureibaculum flavum]